MTTVNVEMHVVNVGVDALDQVALFGNHCGELLEDVTDFVDGALDALDGRIPGIQIRGVGTLHQRHLLE